MVRVTAFLTHGVVESNLRRLRIGEEKTKKTEEEEEETTR